MNFDCIRWIQLHYLASVNYFLPSSKLLTYEFASTDEL